MTIDNKKEFGDYQTPPDFCDVVLSYISNKGLLANIDAVLEPTCGEGNFIHAARQYVNKPIYGVEICSKYAEKARENNPTAQIITGNIFNIDIKNFCKEVRRPLVIGNPPWATNAELNKNLPKKLNFKGLKGLDALTGAANFDICEYIILQMLGAYTGTDAIICMLCKSSVARNVILEIDRNRIPYKEIEMLNFNASKVFGISAAACVLVIVLSSKKECGAVVCTVKDLDSGETVDALTVTDGTLKTTKEITDLEGVCQLTWRQGVKHDCGKVMELEQVEAEHPNTYKHKKDTTLFRLEPDLVYPLVKSSHFKKPIITEFKKFVIVTQKKAREDTSYISQYPLTWYYLHKYAEDFENRKSVIYKDAPPFSMFGIGEYSYKPYKVGLSGFYKRPLFALLYSEDGKPVMTDDTAYFLAFDDYNTAYAVMLLLNSETVQNFLLSIAFLDSKRPYTVKLLSRLDFKKCISNVTYKEMQETEAALQLSEYITEEQYNNLKTYINSL